MSRPRPRRRSADAPHRVAPGLYTLHGHTIRRESRHGGVWGDWSVYQGSIMVDWARTLVEAVNLVPMASPTMPIATPPAGASRAFGNADRHLPQMAKLRAPRYGRGELPGCTY